MAAIQVVFFFLFIDFVPQQRPAYSLVPLIAVKEFNLYPSFGCRPGPRGLGLDARDPCHSLGAVLSNVETLGKYTLQYIQWKNNKERIIEADARRKKEIHGPDRLLVSH